MSSAYVRNVMQMYTCILCIVTIQSWYLCRKLIWAAVVLLPILGCTWIIGILSVNEDYIAFAWIFTILNSFQVRIV